MKHHWYLLWALGLLACAPEPSVGVTHATIRAPLPGQTTSVGYFDITNTTKESITLVGATSSTAARVEMHSHTLREGLMQMRKVDQVEVPAGETVRFETGGLHLMLFDVVELDRHATVTLQLADGQTLPVSFVVIQGTS